MKRLNAPEFWPIGRKIKKFVVTPLPGTHPSREAIPLAILLRDILGYAENMKEVKQILNAGLVRVDNKIRKNTRFSVGLMDVVSLGDSRYRVMPSKKGLRILEIDKGEAGIKLKKIRNKTALKKGKIQLNFHDGTNFIIDNARGKDYSTGDVAVFDLEIGKIKDVIKYESGTHVIITKGTRAGAYGKLEKKIVTKSPSPNIAEVLTEGEKLLLPADYIFPVGKDKPLVMLEGGTNE